MSTLDVRADLFDAPLPPTPLDAPFDFDVAIVGLGYVGLPTALAYHASGSRVIALDASSRRLRTIASRGADLIDSDRERLDTALRAPAAFRLTGDIAELSRAAAIVVCVPTPVDARQVPDLTALRAACATVVAAARPGQLIMLTSTTYVGCTRDLVESPLRERGMRIGRDVFVTFSAERIDPGNIGFAQEAVPRVVGGATPECEEEGARLLARYADRVHRVSSLATAEMTKLLENTFRAVNIALANEFADICGALDVPVTEVIEAASTKPYGFMAFYPGPGVGGHCIPCDPHYLLRQLRERRPPARSRCRDPPRALSADDETAAAGGGDHPGGGRRRRAVRVRIRPIPATRDGLSVAHRHRRHHVLGRGGVRSHRPRRQPAHLDLRLRLARLLRGMRRCRRRRRLSHRAAHRRERLLPHPHVARQNPFYLDLPFDDVNDEDGFATRGEVVPWAADPTFASAIGDPAASLMKNRWVALHREGRVCYGRSRMPDPASTATPPTSSATTTAARPTPATTARASTSRRR